MRKLVSIQQVKDIMPIEGADAIELAQINGWQCVVKKNEFKKGDLGVYFEIDSFLPIEPEFEFLRKSSYKKMGDQEGFRLKTVKLRGEISQGLILPLSLFPKLFQLKHDTWINRLTNSILVIGEEFTDELKVEKYEAPIPAEISGDVCGIFPSFIPKTDEERIQNLPDYFEKFKDVEFEESLKLDGTSMTVFRTFETINEQTEQMDNLKGKFGVCMRNYELKRSNTNTLWKVALDLKLHEILDAENLEIAIQGELMGPGIQKNREKFNKHEFFIFRIWDIKNRRFFTSKEKFDFIEKVKNKYGIELKHTPIINHNIKIFNFINSMNDMLSRASGHSINNPIREGIVFKAHFSSSGDKNDGFGGNNNNEKFISFKAINNLFLLKTND